jgi:hypothetical protein
LALYGWRLQIFIDESGTFTSAKSGPSISVVGALILPDYRSQRIERKYRELRPTLSQANGKVKGRLPDEQQIASCISLLKSNETLYWVAAMDLSVQSEAEAIAHQMTQAEGITKNITPKHQPNLRRQLQEIRSSLESMTPQLYVQSVLSFELIHRTLKEATLHFSQRQPKELARSHWKIDAKGSAVITSWERWWMNVALPMLQIERDPWPMLVEGDYSFMKRF